MSLDVYLTYPTPSTVPPRPAIFVRRAGTTVEISRAEWDRLNPGLEPAVVFESEDREATEAYRANITHNLTPMATAAGIYQEIWRPEEIGLTKAAQLLEPLLQGLSRLLADRAAFAKYNPPNGWGDYDAFVRFVANYLAACVSHPQADVSVSR